jgi:hypothetical protein
MRVVAELNGSLLQHPFPFDVNALIGIHEDVRNRRVSKEWFEWAEPENFVKNLLRQALPFLQIHRCGFTDNQRFENMPDLAPNLFPVNFR